MKKLIMTVGLCLVGISGQIYSKAAVAPATIANDSASTSDEKVLAVLSAYVVGQNIGLAKLSSVLETLKKELLSTLPSNDASCPGLRTAITQMDPKNIFKAKEYLKNILAYMPDDWKSKATLVAELKKYGFCC